MPQTNNNTPKDVFLHLFNIFTFYLSVIAFITLWVQYVNKLFPDNLTYYFDNISNMFTWSSAVLVITVPAFIITTWLLEKDIKKVPEKKDFILRKWLLYFTLFIAGVTFVIDLITFVMYFFRGELTTRFFLKVLVVLLVAAAVFVYYLWELKRKEKIGNTLKFLSTILAVVVIGSITVGFFVVGTPKEQRNRKFDTERIQDFTNIQTHIIDYWSQKEKLPENLEQLNNDISGFTAPKDPVSGLNYEYNVKGDLTFELCANFDTTLSQDETKNIDTYYYDMTTTQNWAHEKGHVCFERTIDPELYKNSDNTMLNPKVIR